MDELGRFLAQLGLQQHEAAFRATTSTSTSSGSSRRPTSRNSGCRSATAASCSPRSPPAWIAATADDGPPPPEPPAAPAGRRDGGSSPSCSATSSARRRSPRALDPERMEQLLHAYQDACVAEIARFGGFVERYMGDGILAYFGYPRADEDAAERAVRAGLGIVGAVKHVPSPTGPPLAVRIGIASGLVVTRGPAQRAGVSEPPVTGETVNLAARLQACAGPDSVAIAAGTRRLVGALFELEDLGETRAEGHPGPGAGLARGPRAARGDPLRGDAPGGRGGRPSSAATRRSRLLLDRWELAKAATARSCCCPARPASASRGSARPCASASPPTATARSLPVLALPRQQRRSSR